VNADLIMVEEAVNAGLLTTPTDLMRITILKYIVPLNEALFFAKDGSK